MIETTQKNIFADLIGVPYAEHGRDPAKGLDCYGLAIEAESRLGKKLNDVWYDESHDLSLCDENYPTLGLVKTETHGFGDIVAIDINGRLHIGVCVGKNEFIHAARSGVRISPLKAFNIEGFFTWE